MKLYCVINQTILIIIDIDIFYKLVITYKIVATCPASLAIFKLITKNGTAQRQARTGPAVEPNQACVIWICRHRRPRCGSAAGAWPPPVQPSGSATEAWPPPAWLLDLPPNPPRRVHREARRMRCCPCRIRYVLTGSGWIRFSGGGSTSEACSRPLRALRRRRRRRWCALVVERRW